MKNGNKALAYKMMSRALSDAEEAIINLQAALEETTDKELADDEAYAALQHAIRVMKTRLGQDAR